MMMVMMVRAVRTRIASDAPVLLLTLALMVVRVMVLVVTMVVLRASRC